MSACVALLFQLFNFLVVPLEDQDGLVDPGLHVRIYGVLLSVLELLDALSVRLVHVTDERLVEVFTTFLLEVFELVRRGLVDGRRNLNSLLFGERFQLFARGRVILDHGCSAGFQFRVGCLLAAKFSHFRFVQVRLSRLFDELHVMGIERVLRVAAGRKADQKAGAKRPQACAKYRFWGRRSSLGEQRSTDEETAQRKNMLIKCGKLGPRPLGEREDWSADPSPEVGANFEQGKDQVFTKTGIFLRVTP
jgi:hypothetical protein